MSDDFDDLKSLLNISPPPPSDERKKQAIFNAMQAFDEKNAKTSQGNANLARLIHAARTALETYLGRQPMKKAYILAGGVALGALTVSLLNTSILTQTMPELAQPKKEQVAGTAAMPPQVPSQDLAAVNTPAVAASAAPAEVSNAAIDGVANPSAQDEEKEQAVAKLAGDLSKNMKSRAQGGNAMGSVSAPVPVGAGDAAHRMAAPGVSIGILPPHDTQPYSYHDEGRDKFEDIKVNPVKIAKDEPVSTFSTDVDTASYSFVRSSLNNNALPQKDAVRIEEMVNYFPYDYAKPESKNEPFKLNVAVFPTPWNAGTKIVHIGIKGYQLEQKEKPRSNLVFLVDTSGSMNEPNKLPLLQNSLKLLLDSLKPEDTVAIVTYAGSAGTVLEPTQVKDKAKILSALDNLNAGGSTAGAEGIRQAYNLAAANFDKAAVNRVMLATDGDFNVGITNPEELKSFVEREREKGIFLSVLGFGRGNYNDALMQTLAQNGNGNAAYIDNLSEARKMLVEEAGSTLFPIAKDVKIQVEFNANMVAEYRLIGYETRLLNREDFNNDKVDAGDIGAGHTVTALYEITPVGSSAKLVDDLRYGKKQEEKKEAAAEGEYAFVKLRYKLPESSTSKLITQPVDAKVEAKTVDAAPQEARFAASVAAFAQLLRGDAYTQNYTYDDVINLAEGAKGKDNFGYRAEFINLVRLAKSAPALQPLGR